MSSVRKVIPFLMAFILLGCATSYQKMGFSGGFDETQLAENVWKVHFSGNGYTGRNRAEEMTLLRSADLTMQNGFRFFVLASSNSASDYSTYTTPTTSTTTANAYGSGGYAYGTANTTTYGGQTYLVSKPSTTNTVVMFKDRPQVNGVVYDANFLCNTLGSKLTVSCGTLR
jgi:hypothetical protein